MITIEPELTATEQCLLEVINEPKLEAYEKAKLLQDYAPVISTEALLHLFERVSLVEHLKAHFGVEQRT